MKIMFISRDFSVLTQTFVYDRANALSAAGHNVRVLSFRSPRETDRPFDNSSQLKKSPSWKRVLRKAYAGTWLPSRLTWTTRQNNDEVNFSDSLRREVREFGPDVIHAEFGQMGVFANSVASDLKIPLIVFMHGYDISKLPRSREWFTAYKRLWRPEVMILTPSQFMRKKVIELGASPSNVVVQHNGVDIERFSFTNPASRFRGTTSFLFVGRLVEKKGPFELLKAFDILKRQDPSLNVELIYCGGGALLEGLRAEIKQLGLEQSVKTLGDCSHEAVRRLMGEAHIAVQHSITTSSGDMEGLPVSLTEAAASGLPIVSTRHSGIPEIVQDGINGFLVPEGDIEGMAACMLSLARSPEAWSRLAVEGRKIIEREFSSSVTVASYEAIATNLITNLPARSRTL